MIDTKRVPDRPKLRFHTVPEALGYARTLADADRDGRLRGLGNWSLGRTLHHLGEWTRYAYDGYPSQLKAPWFVRVLSRFMKNRFIHKPMPAGVKIPRIEGGTLAQEEHTTADGLATFERQMTRLQAAPPATAHPLIGPLTHEEWIASHLRHAELHLSFFAVDGGTKPA